MTPGSRIKDSIENYLAGRGVDLGGRGRVLMLANARVLGHVFNPLSVFWCFDSSGRLACIVARSTTPTASGTPTSCTPTKSGIAVAGKDFHVSPFFDVTGTYGLRFTLSRDWVSTTVTLRREGTVAFHGVLPGLPKAADLLGLARLLIRQPLMTQRVSALIRVHGGWLWLRGLPIRPRPRHIAQEGV